jgi:Bifunctional DNA primase/polymerase, N-terminal
MNAHMSDNEILDAALAYIDRRWPVFPLHSARNNQCSCGRSDCKQPGKHPRVQKGLKEASLDRETVADWFTRWPDSNIGIVTGSVSGFVVLDIDPRHDGDKSLASLEAENGTLPLTVEAATGGGGRHILFRTIAERSRIALAGWAMGSMFVGMAGTSLRRLALMPAASDMNG